MKSFRTNLRERVIFKDEDLPSKSIKIKKFSPLHLGTSYLARVVPIYSLDFAKDSCFRLNITKVEQ